MQNENDMTPLLDPAAREFETALGGLVPATVSFDRDALIFNAGARSARGAVRRWQSTAGLLAACMGLALLVHLESKPAEIVKLPLRQTTLMQASASRPERSNSPYTLAALRRAVMQGGIDALPIEPLSRGAEHPNHQTPSIQPHSIFESAYGDRL